MHGTSYNPPPAIGLLDGCTPSNPVAAWIEQTYREGLLFLVFGQANKILSGGRFYARRCGQVDLASKKRGQISSAFINCSVISKHLFFPCLSLGRRTPKSRNSGRAGTLAPLNCCPKTSVDIRQLSRILTICLEEALIGPASMCMESERG